MVEARPDLEGSAQPKIAGAQALKRRLLGIGWWAAMLGMLPAFVVLVFSTYFAVVTVLQVLLFSSCWLLSLAGVSFGVCSPITAAGLFFGLKSLVAAVLSGLAAYMLGLLQQKLAARERDLHQSGIEASEASRTG